MGEKYKQIKDLPIKQSIDGTEDVLIQSNGVTMRVKANQVKSTIDLSNYYTKSQVDGLLANLNVNVDMADYYDKTSIDALLSQKANTTDIPSLNGYATETYVMDKLGGKSLVYLTQSEYDVLSDLEKQDITKVYNITDATEEIDYNNIVNKPTIPTKTSELTNDSNFVNKTYVSTAIANAQLGGGSGSSVDLSLYATKEEVATSLNTKSDVSHTHVMADITDLNVSGGGGITTVTYGNLSDQLKAIFVVIK